jgi:hypothetical protein
VPTCTKTLIGAEGRSRATRTRHVLPPPRSLSSVALVRIDASCDRPMATLNARIRATRCWWLCCSGCLWRLELWLDAVWHLASVGQDFLLHTIVVDGIVAPLAWCGECVLCTIVDSWIEGTVNHA